MDPTVSRSRKLAGCVQNQRTGVLFLFYIERYKSENKSVILEGEEDFETH
jgi:hypothetical protein